MNRKRLAPERQGSSDCLRLEDRTQVEAKVRDLSMADRRREMSEAKTKRSKDMQHPRRRAPSERADTSRAKGGGQDDLERVVVLGYN